MKKKLIEFFDYKVYRIIVGGISRLIYGNDAGLFNNISGRKVLKKANSKSLHVKNLLTDGYSLLEYNFHDSTTVKEVCDAYSKVISDVESRSPSSRKVSFAEPLLTKVPSVKKLISPQLRDVLDSYYGLDQWRVSRAEAWRNYYWNESVEKEVHSDLMHNDYDSTEILRVFVFLSDGITRENGSTKLISISDTKAVMRRGYITRNKVLGFATKYLNTKAKILYLEGNSGFSFIFNPQLCLHAAGRVGVNGIRDVLVFSFCRSSKPFTSAGFDDMEMQQNQRLASGLSMEWK